MSAGGAFGHDRPDTSYGPGHSDTSYGPGRSDTSYGPGRSDTSYARPFETLPSAFCSFDGEFDGTNPISHSMRSLGIALFDEQLGLVDTFYATISPRPGSTTDEKTMRNFWDKHPAQWRAVNERTRTPERAMADLANWLKIHSQIYTLKWVACPANADWMWLKCYYEAYGPPDKPDLGFYCHCLSTMLRSYFLAFPVQDKKMAITELSGGLPHTHNALDDALCQGTIYMNLRKLFNRTKQRTFR